jgi:hypothetical protein
MTTNLSNGFRYNNKEGIGTFPSDTGRQAALEQIPLPDNYRCSRAIVNLANEIAAQAGSRKSAMVPARAEEGSVDFVVWPSLDDEIRGVADVVAANGDSKYLIMVTRQFIGYRLKALLGDDAVTTFREQVLSVHAVRERFALATLLANESDAVAVRAWLALEWDGPRPAAHRNVEAYASIIRSGRIGACVIDGVVDGSIPVQGSGTKNVRDRAAEFVAAKRVVPTELVEQLRWLFDPSIADAMAGRPIPDGETDAARAARERLDEEDRAKARGDFDLLQRSSAAIAQGLEQPDLSKVIDILRYRIGTQAPLLDDEQIPRVQIMTLHGAKGLQQRNVIVAGLSNEAIPGPADEGAQPLDEAARVEEQRRLLYVAVTRAQDALVLSWSREIAGADTRRNGITRIDPGVRRGGIYVTPMTRTGLLPPSRQEPEAGADWVARHTGGH